MTTQQLSEILANTVQYVFPILLVFLLSLLVTALLRIKALSHKISAINQYTLGTQEQLHASLEKQEGLLQQLHVQKAEMQRFEQGTAAIIDRITGLPNYHAVMSRINAELSRCKRTQSSCAILFMHLDSFNHIYTTWGQDASDATLREASSRLLQNTRNEDFIGHYSRENFVLLLVETDLAGAIQTAERLRREISSTPYFWSTEDPAPETLLEITVSTGIAAYSLHGTTTEVLIQYAASAMHYANHDGGNRTRIADIDEDTPTSPDDGDDNDDKSIDELSTINALTAAASAHHIETDNHAHRLVTLMEETAHEVGCTEQELRIVRLSALLHDIGKIGIPDAILDKPGPLTDEEWEVMRLHPQIGQRILSQAGGIFATLAHVIVAHHERWDGKGYPIGLSEHNIPIEARILTVVDAFDAMISQRPYRQPVSSEEARLELLRCAGSQFDPEVVIAFLRVLNRSLQPIPAIPDAR
jgi:diguanylate cyclase (GGDEF)-like protein